VRIRQMQGTAYRLTEAPLQRVLDILMAQETVDDEDLANAWPQEEDAAQGESAASSKDSKDDDTIIDAEVVDEKKD
jgi:hypothetical protein